MAPNCLKLGKKCSYPGIQDANVMWNDSTFGQIKGICTPTELQYIMYLRPVYYHEKSLKVWLTVVTLNPHCYRKYYKMTKKISKGCLATSDSHNFNNSFTTVFYYSRKLPNNK